MRSYWTQWTLNPMIHGVLKEERRPCENGGRAWGAVSKPRNAHCWQPPEARTVIWNRSCSEPAEATPLLAFDFGLWPPEL